MNQGRRAGRAAGYLPAELTSFVDRRAELAEVKRLLSTARLVTLTGVGGTGKTRLAVRAGSELRRAYPDGVWHVELGTLSDGGLVAYAVVETLRLYGSRELSATRQLAGCLAGRELLLILDNCEHLVDACAELTITLLGTCPGLRILCTSRQPLGVVGETVFTVTPLEVPTDGETLAPDSRPYSALRLFVERAAAVTPGFALGSHNEPVVADICARLDGLPLAIELAAARLRTLTVEQVAAGLADRFKMLTARHAVPLHHRQLRDTFGWSFELCSAAERLLWARLAVFGGSFDLDAVVAVCASDDLPGRGMLDMISDLVDKSIVIREDSAGQVRYRLLETVREYGLGRLPAGDSLVVLRRRHRDWYLRLAERFDADWFGPDQVQWVNRLHTEWTNLRAALGWCLTTAGELDAGLRLVAALHWFWTGCGASTEGRYWLERALAAEPRPTLARGRAMSVYTQILITQADAAAARVSAEETLSLARTLGDPLLLARAYYEAATIYLFLGDLDRSRVIGEDALARFVALGTAPLYHVMTLTTLAYTLLYRGDAQRAELLRAQAQEICQRRGDRWWLGYTLLARADMAFHRDATAEGERYAQEALPLHDALGAGNGIVAALDILAYAATLDGDMERAACLLGTVATIAQPLGLDPVRRRGYWRGREDLLDSIQSTLGENAFNAALDRGRRMSQDDAVSYALRTGRNATETPTPPTPAKTLLTPREREVAELIAQGLSNRQIATRLVISQRTAESHVENILRKLGFASRAQVATWVLQQRTAPG